MSLGILLVIIVIASIVGTIVYLAYQDGQFSVPPVQFSVSSVQGHEEKTISTMHYQDGQPEIMVIDQNNGIQWDKPGVSLKFN